MKKPTKQEGRDEGEAERKSQMLTTLNPFEFIEFIYLKSDINEVNNALEKYIIIVSSHPDILTDPLANLPDPPDRMSIANNYIKSLNKSRIMQNIMREQAEDSGRIDALVDREYSFRLRKRVLEIHKLLSEKGLFDLSQLAAGKFTIHGEGGAVRVINNSPYEAFNPSYNLD